MSALMAEWHKARTLPSTPWLAAGLTTSMIVAGVLAGITVQPRACSSSGGCGDLARLALSGVWVGQVLAATLGVLSIGNEHGTEMFRTTLTAIPRRLRVVATKTIILIGLVSVPSLCGAVVASLLGRRLYTARGLDVVSQASTEAVARATFGTALYLTLIAALSLGVAALVRDTAGAMSAVLTLLHALPALAVVVENPHLRAHLQQLAPSSGMAIQATTHLEALPAPPWTGLGVLTVWTITTWVAGAFMVVRRDAR